MSEQCGACAGSGWGGGAPGLGGGATCEVCLGTGLEDVGGRYRFHGDGQQEGQWLRGDGDGNLLPVRGAVQKERGADQDRRDGVHRPGEVPGAGGEVEGAGKREAEVRRDCEACRGTGEMADHGDCPACADVPDVPWADAIRYRREIMAEHNRTWRWVAPLGLGAAALIALGTTVFFILHGGTVYVLGVLLIAAGAGLFQAARRERKYVRAVVAHHAKRGHELCWQNDDDLYAVFGLIPPNRELPPRAEFSRRCKEYEAGQYLGVENGGEDVRNRTDGTDAGCGSGRCGPVHGADEETAVA